MKAWWIVATDKTIMLVEARNRDEATDLFAYYWPEKERVMESPTVRDNHGFYIRLTSPKWDEFTYPNEQGFFPQEHLDMLIEGPAAS